MKNDTLKQPKDLSRREFLKQSFFAAAALVSLPGCIYKIVPPPAGQIYTQYGAYAYTLYQALAGVRLINQTPDLSTNEHNGKVYLNLDGQDTIVALTSKTAPAHQPFASINGSSIKVITSTDGCIPYEVNYSRNKDKPLAYINGKTNDSNSRIIAKGSIEELRAKKEAEDALMMLEEAVNFLPPTEEIIKIDFLNGKTEGLYMVAMKEAPDGSATRIDIGPIRENDIRARISVKHSFCDKTLGPVVIGTDQLSISTSPDNYADFMKIRENTARHINLLNNNLTNKGKIAVPLSLTEQDELAHFSTARMIIDVMDIMKGMAGERLFPPQIVNIPELQRPNSNCYGKVEKGGPSLA